MWPVLKLDVRKFDLRIDLSPGVYPIQTWGLSCERVAGVVVSAVCMFYTRLIGNNGLGVNPLTGGAHYGLTP